jgi:hypothetical protein
VCRYGVKNLISSLLSVGLVVHWRFISNSQFRNNAYTDTPDSDPTEDVIANHDSNRQFNVSGCTACAQLLEDIATAPDSSCSGSCSYSSSSSNSDSERHPRSYCESCESIMYNHIRLFDTFRHTACDDYLTSELAEAPYYKWMFMIIHWQRRS